MWGDSHFDIRQPASAMDLASLLFCNIPDTFRSSMQILWFSRTSPVLNLCRTSRRLSDRLA